MNDISIEPLSKVISVVNKFKNIKPDSGSEFANLFRARFCFAMHFCLFSLNISEKCSIKITDFGVKTILITHPFFEITVYYSFHYQGFLLKAMHSGDIVDITCKQTFQEFSEKPEVLLKAIHKRLQVYKIYQEECQEECQREIESIQDQVDQQSIDEYYGLSDSHFTRAFRD